MAEPGFRDFLRRYGLGERTDVVVASFGDSVAEVKGRASQWCSFPALVVLQVDEYNPTSGPVCLLLTSDASVVSSSSVIHEPPTLKDLYLEMRRETLPGPQANSRAGKWLTLPRQGPFPQLALAIADAYELDEPPNSSDR